MKKGDIIKFIILVGAFLSTVVIGLCIEDASMAFLSLAGIAALVFGFYTANIYALSGQYAREVLPLNEKIIKKYKELQENYKSHIQLDEKQYNLQRIVNVKQYCTIIFLCRAILEFAQSNHPATKYANRWMDKKDEVLKEINETLEIENNPEKVEEIFDALENLYKAIETGEIDIKRD